MAETGEKCLTGVISNIQRFSLHDGPGVRSTVFFKGCPLRCFWCHNPETREYGPELRYKRADCVFCGTCLSACRRSALTLGDSQGCGEIQAPGESHNPGECQAPGESQSPGECQGELRLLYDRAVCVKCFACAAECPTGALAVSGQTMSVADVVNECLRDASMYERTGGGVTLSGGEASGQYHFALALIKALKAAGMRVALDTCGYCPRERLLELASLSDLVLYDIKHADPRAHRMMTGADNELILSNLRYLSASLPYTDIEARIPVIPGYNDDEGSVSAIAAVIADNPGVKSAVLLAYHPLGRSKIYDFDHQSAQNDIKQPSRAQLVALSRLVHTLTGIPVSYR